MRIIIVEDEHLIAQRIQRMIREILGVKISYISIETTLEDAIDHILGTVAQLKTENESKEEVLLGSNGDDAGQPSSKIGGVKMGISGIPVTLYDSAHIFVSNRNNIILLSLIVIVAMVFISLVYYAKHKKGHDSTTKVSGGGRHIYPR